MPRRNYAVLELFCGAGLATRGLIRAGATPSLLIGIDNRPQPRFPKTYLFMQHDITDKRVRKHIIDIGRNSDFVWASPPCQFGSVMRHAPGAKKHKNLIPFTRDLLEEIGKPYCIENVYGAREHLRNPVTLDGTMFGLGVELGGQWYNLERKRCFETSWQMKQPLQHESNMPVIGVYGSHARVRAASVPGGRSTYWPFKESQSYAASTALGVTGLTLAEMSQGIPPAYAAHIFHSFKRQAAR